MQTNGNGALHYNDPVVDKLVAAGLLQEADRDDPMAVEVAKERALEALLDKFMSVPGGHPISNFFITPQIECAANTHLMLGLLELLVATGVLPPKAVEALVIHSQATGAAACMPAGLHQLLNHYARVLDWGLKPFGASIDAKAITQRGQR
jgi:hypothetical protein